MRLDCRLFISKFFLFFLIVVFGSCSTINNKKTSCQLSKEEKADLDYLLRFLLFESYGSFVLFGSKPLCEMEFVDTEVTQAERQKRLQAMSIEERAQYEAEAEKLKAEGLLVQMNFERNLFDGWKVIEKIRPDIKKYLIIAHPLEYPGVYSLFLVDILKTAFVLEENYEVFKKAVEMDFDPLKIVFEIENSDSVFWKRVFDLGNHEAKGLLFGFGKKNALFYEWEAAYENTQGHLAEFVKSVSFKPTAERTLPLGKDGPDNFTIPIFGTLDDQEIVEKYEKEKKDIEKIYRGKDLVEVTLQKLLQ